MVLLLLCFLVLVAVAWWYLKYGSRGPIALELQLALHRALESIRVNQTVWKLEYRTVTSLKQIAEGGFSRVFLVRDQNSEELMALKHIMCFEAKDLELVKTEIAVLTATYRHPNVIELVDHANFTPGSGSTTQQGATEYMLLFPYYPRGTAWDLIVHASSATNKLSNPWPFPEPVALKLFADVCQGVLALHSAGFMHRDVKPLNVLLAEDGRGILMDVGSAAPITRTVSNRSDATLLEEEAAMYCSSPYRPPELWHVDPGAVVDGRVDAWSLGCSLFAFAFGHSPFETPTEGVSKLAIMSGNFKFPQNATNKWGCKYSDGFCGIINNALNPDPKNRSSVSLLLESVSLITQGVPTSLWAEEAC